MNQQSRTALLASVLINRTAESAGGHAGASLPAAPGSAALHCELALGVLALRVHHSNRIARVLGNAREGKVGALLQGRRVGALLQGPFLGLDALADDPATGTALDGDGSSNPRLQGSHHHRVLPWVTHQKAALVRTAC